MGYCQGLNFIVAHFLLILNDRQTYNAMCHILYWQGHHKLIYYTGYEAEDSFELYDLEVDLEEMNDLVPSLPAFGKRMKEELLDTISKVNAPFEKSKR